MRMYIIYRPLSNPFRSLFNSATIQNNEVDTENTKPQSFLTIQEESMMESYVQEYNEDRSSKVSSGNLPAGQDKNMSFLVGGVKFEENTIDYKSKDLSF